MIEIKDMPKLESPLVREIDKDEDYVCIPKLREEYRWFITNKCLATDKLDGTCLSVVIEDNKIKKILNRLNVIDIWKSGKWFYDGIKYAIDSQVFNPELLDDDQYFGELIGERINGNPYKIKGHRWVPFDYMKKKYFFKFWSDVIKECENKTDEEIFKIIEGIFKNLWSIYKRQHDIKGEVNENTKFEGMAAEGIVFYNIETGEMCKLRRDMFKFFKGRKHKEV